MTSGQGCQGCRNGAAFPFEFTMAFHPIINLSARSVWGYEALVRGTDGASAGAVLEAVTEDNRYAFDQACRVKAIELAGARLAGDRSARLSINFMPNAVYEPKACIQASLAAASRAGFDPRRLMFEFTENEHMADVDHVNGIFEAYRHMGFTTAIDDFGAGYAGLGLLAQLQPDMVKIDMDLVRGIADSARRRIIVGAIARMCDALGIGVIAEGVETGDELSALRSVGISLVQGYLFARPEIETFRAADDIAMPLVA